jgi:hypothetical protein
LPREFARPAAYGDLSAAVLAMLATVMLRADASRWLRFRPEGGQEQPYRDSHGNFEESMDGDHYPCRFGMRYKHDDC